MPLSVILILFPLLIACILFLFNNKISRIVAVIASLIELGITIYMLLNFKPTAEAQFVCDMPWVRDMGITFSLGIDGINLLFILLTNLTLFIVILLTLDYHYPKYFYSLVFVIQFALLGVFMSFDALLFYFFWEVALIPIYFIISYWGSGANKVKITFRFFCYTMFGSLLMLFGILYVYSHTDSTSFDILSFYQSNLSLEAQNILFWAFFVAFAIKIPIFPFHSWQRDTYVTAPFIASIILSALMLKMGIYGALRWMVPVLNAASFNFKHIMLVLGLINIIYGGIAAIKRNNIKALIAYSSLSHVGLIFIGIFVLSSTSIEGVLFQSFNHGLVVTALFAIAQIIFIRFNTHSIGDIGGGLSIYSRFFTFSFFIILLSSIAMPLTGGFIGEFMLIKSVFEYNVIGASISVLSVILGAVYMLRFFQKVMLGDHLSHKKNFKILTFSEHLALLILVICTLAIGIYPQAILNLIEPSVKNLLYFIKFIKG